MAKADAYLLKIVDLLTNELGEETGQLFYTSYKGREKPEIIKDARTLLADLVGPEMAIKKIQAAGEKPDAS